MSSRHTDPGLIDAIRKMGCTVSRPKKGGHYRVTYRGKFVSSIASSPSDVRGDRNTLSFIRRNMRKINEKGNTL